MTELAKQPSEDLISMIKVAGDSLLSFGELWGSIKKKGGQEGFSEKELQEMLRPYLKQKMDSKKIWYLFNKEEEQERNKQNYQSRTFKQKIDEKKDTEESKKREQELEKQMQEEELRKKQQADREQEEYEREMAKAKETPTPPAPPILSANPKVFSVDDAFNSLPDDNSMTCWKIPKISGAALKNKISAWQGNSNKMFRVWMQEV